MRHAIPTSCCIALCDEKTLNQRALHKKNYLLCVNTEENKLEERKREGERGCLHNKTCKVRVCVPCRSYMRVVRQQSKLRLGQLSKKASLLRLLTGELVPVKPKPLQVAQGCQLFWDGT